MEDEVEVDEETYVPAIALWIDAHTGETKDMVIYDPTDFEDQGYHTVIQSLINGLLEPAEEAFDDYEGLLPDGIPAPTSPWLPGKFIVDDPELAVALRKELAAVTPQVEVAESLPLMDEAFEAMLAAIGFADDDSEAEADDDDDDEAPFEWEIDPQIAKDLFGAANALYAEHPWTYHLHGPYLTVELDNALPLYVDLTGETGMNFAVFIYDSLETLLEARAYVEQINSMSDSDLTDAISQLEENGVPVAMLEPSQLMEFIRHANAAHGEQLAALMNEALVCSFDATGEVTPGYLEWVAEFGLRGPEEQVVPSFYTGDEELEMLTLEPDEVAVVHNVLVALRAFFNEHRDAVSAAAHAGTDLQFESVTTPGHPVRIALGYPDAVED